MKQRTQLSSCRLRLFLATSGRETDSSLEGVIDEPLETSQGSDHDNTDGETVPETTEANLGVDTANGSTHGLTSLLLSIDLGYHDISRVRDNSAEDTSNVTTEERDTGLGKHRVVGLLARESLVDLLDGLLKRGKLNHSVRNLTGPQRGETLVETSKALSGNNLLVAIENRRGERRNSGLGTDFDSFPGAEQDISDNLSRGRGNEVEKGVILVSNFLTDKVGVFLLEELVETVFTSTLELEYAQIGSISYLHTIAKQG